MGDERGRTATGEENEAPGSEVDARGRGADRLLLIDGHSLLYRAFFALPPFKTSAGEPTGAVYGFVGMLIRLLQDEAPERVAVAFDMDGPIHRQTAFEAYKAHRPKMPDELRAQIEPAHDLVRAFGIPIFEASGHEADDVIGTLATGAADGGQEALIVTGDRDALQLVRPGIRVLITRKGIKEVEQFDESAVREKMGVTPEQVIDLKGLMGDSSDNIPGVPGIGPKKAQMLLADYGTVEGVFAHLDALPKGLKSKLEPHEEQAMMSKRLATIERDVALAVDWSDWAPLEVEWGAVADAFARFEFKNLIKRLPDGGRKGGEGSAARPGPSGPYGQADADAPDSKAGADPSEIRQGEGVGGGPGTSWNGNGCHLLRTVDELAAWLSEIDPKADGLLLDVVLDHEEPMRSHVRGMGLASGERAAYIGAEAGATRIAEKLGPLFRDPAISKWLHDVKPQRIALARAESGLALDGVTVDTLLLSYLLNPGHEGHQLDDLSLQLFKRPLPPLKSEDGAKRGKGGPKRLSDLDDEEVAAHMGARLEVLRRAGEVLRERLDETPGLHRLYEGLELPLTGVLAEMEQEGIGLDVGRLRHMGEEMERRLFALTERVYEVAGEEFNLNSPKQLGHILFEKLGLPVLKRTKTGPSTSAEVLEQLGEEHEIVATLLEYRQLAKLKSTYLDALPELIHPETGRLHTTFNQTVAATGRLSSTNPNLQNIPVRTLEGARIRSAFTAGSGETVLLAADYSQIELRVLAHLAEDASLQEAFRSGEDIHARTASEIFGIPLDEVSGQARSSAKAINFGIVYGISSFGLSKGTGLSRSDAQAYIDEYFARYPGVKRYMDETIARAKEDGFVTTLFGRRRYLPDIHSRHYVQRSFSERMAINTPVQGSAADIIKMAMLTVAAHIRESGVRARMLLQVHDELIFEVPMGEVEEVSRLVKETMEGVTELAVPLQVDVGTGSNWLEAK